MRRLAPVLAVAVATAASASTASAAVLPSGRVSYREPDDYARESAALVSTAPGLVRTWRARQVSVEGRPLGGLEIAAGVQRRDDGRPTFLIMALTHAREWGTGDVAMEFATDLVRRYGHDRRITGLLRRVRVVIDPVVNPDGFAASRLGATEAARMHRTNCAMRSPGEAGLPCSLRAGVDLNRNAGFGWGGAGAEAAPGGDLYRGPAPWSEPESQALHDLSASRNVTGVVSLHSYGGQVLRQPGFSAFGPVPDGARQRRLGDAMGRATDYTSKPASGLYEATGGQEDWNYAAQDALAYTIELGGHGFQPPFAEGVRTQYLGTRHLGGVREALLRAAQAAADPAGHVVLRGLAPAGRIIVLQRSFTTRTSPVCPADPAAAECPTALAPLGLADTIRTETVVPASGRVRWDVVPSTGPQDEVAGRTTAWTLRCEAPEGFLLAQRRVVARRGTVRRLGDLCSSRR